MAIPLKISLILMAFLALASITHSKRISHVANYRKENSALEIPSLEERVRALNALSERHPAILPLSLKEYRQLVFPSPRNFSVFVLFTNGNNDMSSDPEELDEYRRCDKCEEASIWWRHIAGIYFIQEWRRRKGLSDSEVAGEERLYFAAVNIFSDNGKAKVPVDMFKPNFVFFANTTGSKKAVNNTERIWKLNVSQYKNDEFPRYMHILDLIAWIEEQSGVFIDLRTQPPKLTATGGTIIWGVVLLSCYVVWRYCNVMWLLEQAWEQVKGLNYKYMAVLITIWCTSGQMFNQIRQTGWAYYDNDRNMVIISGSQGYQLLTESLLVMTLYGINALSMVQLIEQAKQANKEKRSLNYNSTMRHFTAWTTSFVGVLYMVKLKS